MKGGLVYPELLILKGMDRSEEYKYTRDPSRRLEGSCSRRVLMYRFGLPTGGMGGIPEDLGLGMSCLARDPLSQRPAQDLRSKCGQNP